MIDPEDPGTVDIEQLTTPGRLRIDGKVVGHIVSADIRLDGKPTARRRPGVDTPPPSNPPSPATER